jgi:hypothetical protein
MKRGPQLVGKKRKKLILGPVGFFCFTPGSFSLKEEMLAFFFGSYSLRDVTGDL